jgi:hypothetical protein
VGETEFDRYAGDYRATVNEAAGIARVDVDELAGYKARLLLDLMERQLGEARTRKVLDVGCGIGLVDAELVSGVGELHGDRYEPAVAGRGEAGRAGGALHAFRRRTDPSCPTRPSTWSSRSAWCITCRRATARPSSARWPGSQRPGGIVAIIEHNPLNPLTRYIVARCPFDHDAVLLRPASGARFLSSAGLEPGGRGYIAFWPKRSAVIERVERWIAGCPPAPSTTSGRRRARPVLPFHPVRRRAGRADEEPSRHGKAATRRRPCAGLDLVDQLVQVSRWVGAETSLAVWGGGNTSGEAHEADLLGRPVRVLRVKGSGST